MRQLGVWGYCTGGALPRYRMTLDQHAMRTLKGETHKFIQNLKSSSGQLEGGSSPHNSKSATQTHTIFILQCAVAATSIVMVVDISSLSGEQLAVDQGPDLRHQDLAIIIGIGRPMHRERGTAHVRGTAHWQGRSGACQVSSLIVRGPPQ